MLCDFRKNISGARTHFQIEGIKIPDLPIGEINRLSGEGIDPYEFNFEGTDLEKKVAVKGTSEAIAREFMDNCLVDQSGNLPAKTIIFAISKMHAKRLWEAFEKLHPEYKGRLTRVIVSEDPRAQASIKEFKVESLPRIALSVDMLDTGIDVPEVCNLVFAKPVFSRIKFWQMLGRGTRSDNTCKHKEWLPDGKKVYFKVFDFWDNFEYWDMHPEGDQKESGEAITNRIFLVRLRQLEHCMNAGEVEKAEGVKKKLLEDIASLPKDSVKVYKEKVEDRIKRLADEHPAIMKIKNNEMLTESDLRDLELTLNNPELYITEDVLQKVYTQNKGTLVQFVKNILGLYKFSDPAVRIKDAFDTYIIENSRHYNADQLNFIRTVQTVFSKKKHIEYSELYDAPFTNFGINAPMPMFTESELNDFINICGVLEKDIYAGA